MKTIWKFPVVIEGSFVVDMPAKTEVLSVQMQGDEPVMWAKVDNDRHLVQRRFAVRGTGHLLRGDEGRFIGTFQLPDFGLVFHLFEAMEAME